MRCDREPEPHLHAARVTLHGCVQELLDTGKIDDLIERRVDLALAHAENRAVEVDVFPPGQLLVKSGSYLEQASYPAVYPHASVGWCRDARQNFQQCRLAGAISADNAENLAARQFE